MFRGLATPLFPGYDPNEVFTPFETRACAEIDSACYTRFLHAYGKYFATPTALVDWAQKALADVVILRQDEVPGPGFLTEWRQLNDSKSELY